MGRMSCFRTLRLPDRCSNSRRGEEEIRQTPICIWERASLAPLFKKMGIAEEKGGSFLSETCIMKYRIFFFPLSDASFSSERERESKGAKESASEEGEERTIIDFSTTNFFPPYTFFPSAGCGNGCLFKVCSRLPAAGRNGISFYRAPPLVVFCAGAVHTHTQKKTGSCVLLLYTR